MKTCLVPIDFSATSLHAAEFACKLSKQTGAQRIILLNSYYVSVYESLLPSPDLMIPSGQEIDTEENERLEQLAEIKDNLGIYAGGIEIETTLSRSPLLRAILQTIQLEDVELLILGSNGSASDEESHVGSNVVSLSKNSPVPVIIVPPACSCGPVEKVVMACDFKQIQESLPLASLTNILNKYSVELMVVNIDPKHKQADDATQEAEEEAIREILAGYNPQYYYLDSKDVINGIIDFAEDNEAQLVIALPRKYSFFQSLLRESVSQQLTIQSQVPVLLLK